MRNFAFIAVLCIAFCCAHVASAQTASQSGQIFPPIGGAPCSASNNLIAWNGSGDTYCTHPIYPVCTASELLTSYDGVTLQCVDPSAPTQTASTCPSGQTLVNGICTSSPPGSDGCPSGQTGDKFGNCCAASAMARGACAGRGVDGECTAGTTATCLIGNTPGTMTCGSNGTWEICVANK
jgi:hypothetical protein